MPLFERVQIVSQKAQSILMQPYTLAFIALVSSLYPLLLILRHSAQDLPKQGHADSAQIYFSVQDDAASAIPNALLKISGGGQTLTDKSGHAKLLISSNVESRVQVSARGFKEAEVFVQGSTIDTNKLIVLTPLEAAHVTQKPRSGASLPPDSYVDTVRSGPKESGLANDFSDWYSLISTGKPGYEIESIDYTLSGDRRCNEWSECRIARFKNKVFFSFRMQGHSEWAIPRPGISEGVLRVVYKPLTLLSNEGLRSLAIDFARVLHNDVHGLDNTSDELRRALESQRNSLDPSYQKLEKLSPEQLTKIDSRAANAQEVYEGAVNRIFAEDVPMASRYFEELVKREPTMKHPNCNFDVASPTSYSSSGVVMQKVSECSSALDSLARKLPE